jgi:uncharacterized protein (TIGR00661 family)
MKILFGVQATGNGHISRSREVLRYLKAFGHDVSVFFSGRDPSRLTDLEVFAPYRILNGLTFQTDRGKLKFFQTAMRLNLVRFYQEIRSSDASAYDLVITDFEPVTARLAQRFKIPSVAFGHQYAFSYKVPVAGWYPLSLWVIRNFATADHAIGLHWHHFDQPILPPIVPEWLDAENCTQPNKILVYLPFEHPAEVKDLLKPLKSYQFYIYGSGHIERSIDRDHLHLRPYSRLGFLEDLAECNGVICNAGFELLSEALHIGKKLLVKPLIGQMEQMSNALAIARLKLGRVMSELNRREVRRWLDSPAAPPMAYPTVARIIAEWIDQGNWNGAARLAREAWRQTGGADYLAYRK